MCELAQEAMRVPELREFARTAVGCSSDSRPNYHISVHGDMLDCNLAMRH